MGLKHEKINTRSVSGSYRGSGVESTNVGDCGRSSSSREKTSGICEQPQPHQGGGFTGSREGLFQGEHLAGGVRESDSGVARTAGFHREKMGGRSQSKGNEKMKTVVVSNQKGGVGKTATIVHLAFDFEERGCRVAVIDLDTQANASYSLNQYDTGLASSTLFSSGGAMIVKQHFNELPQGPGLYLIGADSALANMEKYTLETAGVALRESVSALRDVGFDIVLIDTAPSLGISMASALMCGDFVLSPIQLEAYSMQGIKKMFLTIGNIRKVNPGLVFLGMMPSMVDSRNPRHKRHLIELEAAYPELMIPAQIGLRSSIADALASQVPVWKIRKTTARAAAKEVRNLAGFIFEKISASDLELQRRIA